MLGNRVHELVRGGKALGVHGAEETAAGAGGQAGVGRQGTLVAIGAPEGRRSGGFGPSPESNSLRERRRVRVTGRCNVGPAMPA